MKITNKANGNWVSLEGDILKWKSSVFYGDVMNAKKLLYRPESTIEALKFIIYLCGLWDNTVDLLNYGIVSPGEIPGDTCVKKVDDHYVYYTGIGIPAITANDYFMVEEFGK